MEVLGRAADFADGSNAELHARERCSADAAAGRVAKKA